MTNLLLFGRLHELSDVAAKGMQKQTRFSFWGGGGGCGVHMTEDLSYFSRTKNLQYAYCYRGHPDLVNQTQNRTETIDFNIFSSSNGMLKTVNWITTSSLAVKTDQLTI